MVAYAEKNGNTKARERYSISSEMLNRWKQKFGSGGGVVRRKRGAKGEAARMVGRATLLQNFASEMMFTEGADDSLVLACFAGASALRDKAANHLKGGS